MKGGGESCQEKNCSQDHSNIFFYRNRGAEREREREVELMFFPSATKRCFVSFLTAFIAPTLEVWL